MEEKEFHAARKTRLTYQAKTQLANLLHETIAVIAKGTTRRVLLRDDEGIDKFCAVTAH